MITYDWGRWGGKVTYCGYLPLCGGTSMVGATPITTKELYIVDLVNHCFQMSMWGFAEVQQYGGVLRHEIRTLLTCFIVGNVGIIP